MPCGFHCLQECGIEKTNKINKAAVRSMAMIEVKRIQKALGMMEIKSFDDIRAFITDGLFVIKADFMNFRLDFTSENVFRWDIPGCFAYEGIKKIGAIDRYECGIIDRARGWFDGLGIAYTLSPSAHGCQMHRNGTCSWEFRFSI